MFRKIKNDKISLINSHSESRGESENTSGLFTSLRLTGKIFCSILLFSTLCFAQNHTKITGQKINCKTCHICDVPTEQDPCLVECPRTEMITVHQSPAQGPRIVKIDKLADKYLPVNFSHRTHAQMSEMSGGCANCHHYNTSAPIMACSDCHSIERKREDISKPDLQAAYHRQCIDCHKEWSRSTDCNSCHLKKGSALADNRNVKDHPEVKEPVKLVYETNHNKGKIVTFFHNEHTKLFGAECVSCHKNDSCTRCHDVSNVQTISSDIPEKITKSGSQHHQPCFTCHANDECSKCHLEKPMGPFNHKASTGWALNRFHEKLECSKCHSSGRFTELDNNCISCHKDFTAGSFRHEKTGLKLDEIHSEFDCSDCHIENNFVNKPACSGCHDDKSYPKDKPGSLIKLTKK